MLRWTKWLLAAVAVVVQFFALYRSAGPPNSMAISGLDKVGHLVIFALPVFLILLALSASVRSVSLTGPSRSLSAGKIITVICPFVAHAVISEIIQATFYRHRTGDPLDVLADVIGMALGVLAFLLVARRGHRPADESLPDRAVAP